MFFKNGFTKIIFLLLIINTSNQFKSISKFSQQDIFNYSKNELKNTLNAVQPNHLPNTYPVTNDGHCNEESRLWSKIQTGEILSGNLHKNKYGNFFIKARLPGDFKNKSITISLSKSDNLLHQIFFDKLANLREIDEIDKENKEVMIEDTLETCKNMVLLKGRSNMRDPKINWKVTPPFHPLRIIDHNQLANIEHEVLITKVDPQKNIVMGELFTHERVEQTRIGYLSFYNEFYKAMEKNQYYHVKCTVESIFDKYIELSVLDGLKGYALRVGTLKGAKVGEVYNLVAIGCDPILHRIFLALDDGELLNKYSYLVSLLEKHIVSDLISRDQWFKVEIMKFASHGVVVRMFGLEKQALAFIPIHFLPYSGCSGTIDSMYISNFFMNKKYVQRYIASKIGKLCYISHYDDTMYVRLQAIMCDHTTSSKGLFDIIDSSNIYPILTTRPLTKWSEEMLKVSKKMASQTLEELQALPKDHFYPSKILFQANGYVYVSINFQMKPNFDFENEGVIGVVNIDEYFGYAKPGTLMHARIDKIKTFKRESALIRNFDNEKKDAIIRNSTILGPANDNTHSHVLFISFQPPYLYNDNYDIDSSHDLFRLLPYHSPTNLESFSKLAEKGYFSIPTYELDGDLYFESREDAIRIAFTKQWYNMYMNEVDISKQDAVRKLYDSLSHKSVHLFEFISSFTDFLKFKTLPIWDLITQFKNLVALIQSIRRVPLENIFNRAFEEKMFYKIMPATLLPKTADTLDFVTKDEVNLILNKFVPEEPTLRNKLVKEALNRSMKLILPNVLVDYTCLSKYVSRADLAISILATLANEKYGLLAMARMRHRMIPIPVFASSRQSMHLSSVIGFDHFHKHLSEEVEKTGVNIYMGIKSMPPWPYLIKSTQNLFSHLADMGMFDIAKAYNRILKLTRPESDNKNIPMDLPEDYITAKELIENDYKMKMDELSLALLKVDRAYLRKYRKKLKAKNLSNKLSKDFKTKNTKEDVEKFFMQLSDMNLEYGIRVPLF